MYCPTRRSSTTIYKRETDWTQWIRSDAGNFKSYPSGDICLHTWKGHGRFQFSFEVGQIVRIMRASSATFDPTCIFGSGIGPVFAPSSCSAWLPLISTSKCSWTCCITAWTWSTSKCCWSRPCVSSPANDIGASATWTAKSGVHFIDSDLQLVEAYSARGNHRTKLSRWWFSNTRMY